MSDDTQRPIIIKRIKKVAGGHHGGAWKIAYADFVTAMMAFFLLMWLLGSTTKGELQGIADYFNTPLKVALQGGSGSGDSSSLLNGGGRDLTRSFGQVKNGDVRKARKTINLQASRSNESSEETPTLIELKAKLESLVEANEALRPFGEQMKIDMTTEGLRIQIVDSQKRPMFEAAGTKMMPYARDILLEIGKALNVVEHKITLSGHTDSEPYPDGERGYSNWELSADRANTARRAMLQGGLEEGRVVRVVGMASVIPYDKDDPLAPVNRRISVLVMNRRTEQALFPDGQVVEQFEKRDRTVSEKAKANGRH